MIYFANSGENIKAVMFDGKFIGNLEDIDGQIFFKGNSVGSEYRTEVINQYKKEYASHSTATIVRS